VSWPEIARLLRDDDPVHPAPRRRLALLLDLHRTVQGLGSAAADVVGRAIRPLALPAGHPLHPGPDWVRQPVPGGVLDLGLGVWRLLPGQDDVVPLPPAIVQTAGLAADTAWSALRPEAGRLAGFAIDRARATGTVSRVLAAVGGVDALTLLALDPVRAWLAAAAGPAGPTLVAAPRRDRAWLGDAATDRDYAQAVWLLTTPAQRGVPEPLSVPAAAEGPIPLTRAAPAIRRRACGVAPGRAQPAGR
jgi:hypothetical protein